MTLSPRRGRSIIGSRRCRGPGEGRTADGSRSQGSATLSRVRRPIGLQPVTCKATVTLAGTGQARVGLCPATRRCLPAPPHRDLHMQLPARESEKSGAPSQPSRLLALRSQSPTFLSCFSLPYKIWVLLARHQDKMGSFSHSTNVPRCTGAAGKGLLREARVPRGLKRTCAGGREAGGKAGPGRPGASTVVHGGDDAPARSGPASEGWRSPGRRTLSRASCWAQHLGQRTRKRRTWRE